MKTHPIIPIAVISMLPLSLFADFSTGFTAAEGYSNGLLSNNANWGSVGDADIFTVSDSSGSGQVDFASTVGKSLAVLEAETYDFTQVGATFTLSIDFQFTDSGVAAGANNEFIGVQYATASNGGSVNTTLLGLRHTSGTGTYSLYLYAAAAPSLSASALGINIGSSDFESDNLRLTSTLTAGATASTWTAEYSLYNIDTDTIVYSGVRDGVVNVGGAAGDSEMYATIQTGAGNFNGISAIGVGEFSSSAVIPEPSTYAMALGVSILGFVGLMRRRRRNV